MGDMLMGRSASGEGVGGRVVWAQPRRRASWRRVCRQLCVPVWT